MSAGKSASQTGHAFVGAFVTATSKRPEAVRHYHSQFPQSPGTKVVLSANAEQINRLCAALEQTSIPFFVVYDSGCPNFFNGERILTGVGFGPVEEKEVPSIAKKMRLL